MNIFLDENIYYMAEILRGYSLFYLSRDGVYYYSDILSLI